MYKPEKKGRKKEEKGRKGEEKRKKKGRKKEWNSDSYSMVKSEGKAELRELLTELLTSRAVRPTFALILPMVNNIIDQEIHK
jgi:hypothetical protein